MRSVDNDITAGSWPDWAVAALALLALGVSLVTLGIQLLDRRRLAAASVDTYLSSSPTKVIVENRGQRAVFDVRFVLHTSGSRWPLKAARCHRIAPAPDGKVEFLARKPIADADALGPEMLTITVTFADSTGRRWVRRNDGRLRRCRWWNELVVDPSDGTVKLQGESS